MLRGVCWLGLTLGLAVGMTQTNPPASEPQSGAEHATRPAVVHNLPPEMKTTTYHGILVDMSCAAKTAAHGEAAASKTPLNRATGECAATANSSQLGMRLDDGRTLRFDLVGNQRALDELKGNKRWSQDASSGKPIRARAMGVMQGDKLIVSAIH